MNYDQSHEPTSIETTDPGYPNPGSAARPKSNFKLMVFCVSLVAVVIVFLIMYFMIFSSKVKIQVANSTEPVDLITEAATVLSSLVGI